MTWPAGPLPGQPYPWQPPAPAPAPARRWAAAVWSAGVVVLLIGTFLPWLYSGRIAKNSYQLADVGQRRLDTAAWIDVLLRMWPFVGPLWAIVVVLLIVRRRTAAAVSSLILGGFTLVVAVAGMVTAMRVSSAYVSGAYPGPTLSTVGAICVLVASVSWLRAHPSPVGIRPLA